MALDESLCQRLQSRVEKSPSGCWLWQGYLSRDGYGEVKVDGKFIRAHRAAYQAFGRGSLDHGGVVRHTCDTPSCINPDHLVLGTHAGNVSDRVERGRSARGGRHGRSKLTEEDVVTIWQALRRGERKATLARRYGVDPRAISQIERRETWRHVTDLLD